MNTPVNFELSKLLKEKGFNEPCRWYMEDGVTLSESNETNDYLFPDYYSAPTIVEVVMWLYDEHGVWIVVSTTISKQFIYKCIDMSGKKDPSKSNYPTCVSKDGTYYNSPTEAYSQAIIYTLKNLI